MPGKAFDLIFGSIENDARACVGTPPSKLVEKVSGPFLISYTLPVLIIRDFLAGFASGPSILAGVHRLGRLRSEGENLGAGDKPRGDTVGLTLHDLDEVVGGQRAPWERML